MTRSKRVFKKRRNVGIPKYSPTATGNDQTTAAIVGLNVDGMPNVSPSQSKIGDRESYSEFDAKNVYDLVDIESFLNILLTICACKSCGEELAYSTNRLCGLATSCKLHCTQCDLEVSYTNSEQIKGTNLYEINSRLVYALRTIGKGQTSGTIMCAVLNLPKPPTKFTRYNEVLGKATKTVCTNAMKEAIEKAVQENDGSRELSVAVDGTWQKRGHTSNNGVVTVTSVDTGCVLDVAIISKFCTCKDKLEGVHEQKCKTNFIGPSGAMEAHGALEIFRRSEPDFGIRYKYYLGDGDSSAFSSVVKSRPYGDQYTIEKMECCGHVQKRMGTRLRKLKLKLGKTVLSDGKTIGGRNRLTDERILAVQKYYGLAIRRNSGQLDNMKRAVWAEYFHLLSTNENPQHGLCEKGEESWCKYQRAIAKKEQYDHLEHMHIPEVIMSKIKPIFQDLADPNLLKKCLHGKSQNPNESINAVIWSRLPKTVFVGLQTMEFGVYDAILNFNKGNVTRCLVLKELGMSVSKNTASVMSQLDKIRVQRGERMLSKLLKKARQRRESAKRKLEEAFLEDEDPDNPSYGAGMY